MWRVAFLGTGDFAVPALEALARAGYPITCVISQPDRPAGRGMQVRPTPARAAAERLGLPHVQAADVNTPEIIARLRGVETDGVRRASADRLNIEAENPSANAEETAALKSAPAAYGRAELAAVKIAGADFGVVTAFGQKLSPALLAALPRGYVNIHGSLLPKYRGAAPYQWAILNGDAETGVSVFQLDEKWDAGPVWAQSATRIGETETADELHDRLALLGAELIVETLKSIEAGTATPLPQDVSLASRAPKLTKADGVVDWTRSAAEVVRRIHGLWSWPAATALLTTQRGRQERVALARARIAETTSASSETTPPGMLRPGGAVQCGRGSVKLLEVKPAGGRLMPFDAFARGRQLAPTDYFTAPRAP